MITPEWECNMLRAGGINSRIARACGQTVADFWHLASPQLTTCSLCGPTPECKRSFPRSTAFCSGKISLSIYRRTDAQASRLQPRVELNLQDVPVE